MGTTPRALHCVLVHLDGLCNIDCPVGPGSGLSRLALFPLFADPGVLDSALNRWMLSTRSLRMDYGHGLPPQQSPEPSPGHSRSGVIDELINQIQLCITQHRAAVLVHRQTELPGARALVVGFHIRSPGCGRPCIR